MKEVNFIDSEICVISDLHIGVHQSSHIWHKIVVDFAEWLKIQLHQQGIRDIVIAGDCWHDRNEVSVLTMHIATQFFKILGEFNIIILVGNHDAYYKDRADVNSIDIFNSAALMSMYLTGCIGFIGRIKKSSSVFPV